MDLRNILLEALAKLKYSATFIGNKTVENMSMYKVLLQNSNNGRFHYASAEELEAQLKAICPECVGVISQLPGSYHILMAEGLNAKQRETATELFKVFNEILL